MLLFLVGCPATGQRLRRLPITPDKIGAALRQPTKSRMHQKRALVAAFSNE